jgi:hypothetical protein
MAMRWLTANANNDTVRASLIPKSKVKLDLKELLIKRAKKHWRETEKMYHSKEFIKGYIPSFTKDLLSLKRNELHAITGFLTGHYPVKYMLKKKNLINNDTCRFCEDHAETAKHLLTNCVALSLKRYMFFTRGTISADRIRRTPLKKLYSFIASLKLLKL